VATKCVRVFASSEQRKIENKDYRKYIYKRSAPRIDAGREKRAEAAIKIIMNI